jgi:hypothetical protein
LPNAPRSPSAIWWDFVPITGENKEVDACELSVNINAVAVDGQHQDSLLMSVFEIQVMVGRVRSAQTAHASTTSQQIAHAVGVVEEIGASVRLDYEFAMDR